MKRITALLIAFLFALSVLPMSALADDNKPYVDADGIYHRISNGRYIAFNTNYDQMVSYFADAFMEHKTSVEYYFATTNPTYAYTAQNSSAEAAPQANALYKELYYDIFFKTDYMAGGGDYLFNTVYNVGSYSSSGFLSAPDDPAEGNERYYTFKITMSNIEYTTTLEQERAVENFAAQFNQAYIQPNSSAYEKVKTIYDFIVRNTIYDYEVFQGKYPVDSERYQIAHSAYGAICGNIDSLESFDYSYKTTVTGERVPVLYDQGRAVCEGYSKLFSYLCLSNGIVCRIVDGDNIAESGKEHDPHEWNYVFLDDGCGDGYKWFQVDTTFASQKSIKQIDLNNYDYFLCGRRTFDDMNHLQPYHDKGMADGEKEQLYDWWEEGTISSYKDYQIPYARLNSTYGNDGIIIKRETNFSEDKVTTAFIHYSADNIHRIEINVIDNDEKITEYQISEENVEGFTYNSKSSKYTLILPYLSNREYVCDNYYANACGDYSIRIEGSGDSYFETAFKIVPLNMNNSASYDSIDVQEEANYSGSDVHPKSVIIDSYDNTLVEGRDYDIYYYSDSEHTIPTVIKTIGNYYVDIAFKGNYSGHYYFDFNVGKINLSKITMNSDQFFGYLPDHYLDYYGISTPSDYYSIGARQNNQKIGDYEIEIDKDYTVSSFGTLNYGNSGTIYLTGKSGSDKILEGTRTAISYSVNKKFDISFLDGTIADTNKTNQHFYTGNAIKPTKFDELDKKLVRGKDYKIVSYSKNINAGKAIVNIEGINGCSGSASLIFIINKTSMTKATVTAKASGSTVTYTVKLGDKTLVKGTDYTESVKTTSTGKTITLTGKGSMSGTTTINVVTGKASLKPKSTKITKLSKGKKSFTVRWSKPGGNYTGYQIQYSLKSSFKGKSTVKINKKNVTGLTVKKLKSKKTYYVRIRTVNKSGGKTYYSAWSAKKSIKTK